jgi:hypothetical protein
MRKEWCLWYVSLHEGEEITSFTSDILNSKSETNSNVATSFPTYLLSANDQSILLCKEKSYLTHFPLVTGRLHH